MAGGALVKDGELGVGGEARFEVFECEVAEVDGAGSDGAGSDAEGRDGRDEEGGDAHFGGLGLKNSQ